MGAVAGSTQPLAAESQAVLRRNHPLLRGKLVRQRIGISRNPRRMQRVHTAHLVLMRVSHHRQRDRQVDLLLDPVEDLGGLVIGPAVSTTSTRPPS